MFSAKPKIAVVLHLFYEDVAFDIIDRLSEAKHEFTLFITHNRALSVPIMLRLHELRRPLVFIMTDNFGRDVWPFFEALRHPSMAAHDLICKLHTKRGDTEINRTWRDYCFDTLLRPANFKATTQRFRKNRKLAMAGPRFLYKRGHSLMYGNREAFTRFAVKNLGISKLPEFGFFAGTMFWARKEIFDGITNAPENEVRFQPEAGKNDGAPEHVFERMFGLLPVLEEGQICLMDADGQAETVDAPGPADRHTVAETFKNLKETGSHTVFTI